MGLRLFCADESASVPRKVILELTCDGDHGLFPSSPVRFEQDGFMAQYEAAMKAGWLDRQEVVLGPCCSGKSTQP